MDSEDEAVVALPNEVWRLGFDVDGRQHGPCEGGDVAAAQDGEMGQGQGQGQGEVAVAWRKAEAWVESVLGGALAAAERLVPKEQGLAGRTVQEPAPFMGGTDPLSSEDTNLLGGTMGALAQLAFALDRLTEELRGQVARDIAGAAAAQPPAPNVPLQATGQRQQQRQQEEEAVHQVCYATLGAVQLSAACHEVVCAVVEEKLCWSIMSWRRGVGRLKDLYTRHRAAQVRQQVLAVQLCAATVPGWDPHIKAAVQLAVLCVPGGWPPPGEARAAWREWEAELGEGTVAQWAVAEVRRALGLRYGRMEGADDMWRLADAWVADVEAESSPWP